MLSGEADPSLEGMGTAIGHLRAGRESPFWAGEGCEVMQIPRKGSVQASGAWGPARRWRRQQA